MINGVGVKLDQRADRARGGLKMKKVSTIIEHEVIPT